MQRLVPVMEVELHQLAYLQFLSHPLSNQFLGHPQELCGCLYQLADNDVLVGIACKRSLNLRFHRVICACSEQVDQSELTHVSFVSL